MGRNSMLIKLREMMTREEGQKGFTLIELIIVMAILAILAAIAVPRYQAIQGVSRIRSDAATAQSICSAARLQETNENAAVGDMADLDPDYWENNAIHPQSAPADNFDLTGGGTDPYEVTWTPTNAPGHAAPQTATEGQVFDIN